MLKSAFLLMAVLLAASLAACRSGDGAPVPPSKVARWDLPVIEALPSSVPEPPIAGTVVAAERVDLASRIGGRIVELRVQEGDAVRRGQLLVRLDAAEVEGGVRQAEASVAAADAAWRDANTDLDRFRALEQRGSVSNNELRKMQLRQQAAEAALSTARATLDTASAQRGQAGLQSPIDGVVVARYQRIGDLAMPGQPVLTLETGKGLLFETAVPESRLASVRVGDTVQMNIDGQNAPLAGSVTRIVPSTDSVARRHTVKISLPAGHGLAAGQFGRVSFSSENQAAVVVLPRTAVVERGGLPGAFVVDTRGQLHFRWLRTGREWGDRIEVTSGLQPHEKVLARVASGVVEGDLIGLLPQTQ